VNRALRAVKLDGEGDEANIDLIRHRGKPHSPQMVLRPVAQHALADDMADHVHGDRDAWRAQPAHRHVVDAHAPYVVVRTFVLSHALQQRVVSRFAAHAARCAHAQVLLRNRRLHGRLVELSRCNDVLAHVAERRTTSSLLPLTETVPMPL